MMWLQISRALRDDPTVIHQAPPPPNETPEQARTREHDAYALKLMLERVFPKKPPLKIESCFGGDGDPHKGGGFDPHSW